MKSATYYIIHFTKANRFVGVAHNYDEAVLISTRDHDTYTDARNELQSTANELNVRLKWFDGEYECHGSGDQMFRKL